MKMELAVLFSPSNLLPALTSSHKTSQLQHIFPQEERPSANRSWILYSPYHAGAEIGTFQTAASHNPFIPFLQQREEKVRQQKENIK